MLVCAGVSPGGDFCFDERLTFPTLFESFDFTHPADFTGTGSVEK